MLTRSINFDMVTYIKALSALSCRSFVSQTETGSMELTVCFPVSWNEKEVSALCSWADKMDPTREKRDSYASELWKTRQPGEKYVPLCRGLNI